MMDKTKSTIQKTQQKPVNVFFVWYSELCRRTNLNPASFVKPAKSTYQTVLDFVADRLKVEEWNPLIQALRQDISLHVISIKSRIGNCAFLHDVDTEEKASRMKRKYGAIWTAYILKQLVKSLSCILRNTDVLTYLELDGLPMFMDYLEPLLQALKKNKTLKTLSFSNSKIEDAGCQILCSYLRLTPNVEVLNLSGCGLTVESATYLAKLIKYQQINRYCESWHNSLRYENPEAGIMCGIKRLTLNCNPNLGDEGLSLILNELEDDLWIKALDLQKCGISENIVMKLLDIVEYNKVLEIVDVRQNDLLNMSTVESILQILKQRQKFSPEFQWCNTAITLSCASMGNSSSKVSFASNIKSVYKTKSAPIKNIQSKISSTTYTRPVRQTQTVEAIHSKNKFANQLPIDDSQKQVMSLNTKLQLEIQKRKQIEKQNEQLQKQLNLFQSSTTTITKCKIEPKPQNKILPGMRKKNGIQKNMLLGAGDYEKMTQKYSNLEKQVAQNRLLKNNPQTKNGFHRSNDTKTNGFKNGHKNGLSANNAYNIFEKIISNGKIIEDHLDEEGLLNYVKDGKHFKQIYDNTDKFINANEQMSSSQLSLLTYVENLMNDQT